MHEPPFEQQLSWNLHVDTSSVQGVLLLPDWVLQSGRHYPSQCSNGVVRSTASSLAIERTVSTCTQWYGVKCFNILRALCLRNRSSVLGVMTRLRAGRPRDDGSISGGDKRYFLFENVYTGCGAHPASYWMEAGALARELKRRREVNCCLRLEPGSRRSGAVRVSPFRTHLLGVHRHSLTFQAACLRTDGTVPS
jgi:hypothetical protein